jgi:hypothetical protein
VLPALAGAALLARLRPLHVHAGTQFLLDLAARAFTLFALKVAARLGADDFGATSPARLNCSPHAQRGSGENRHHASHAHHFFPLIGEGSTGLAGCVGAVGENSQPRKRRIT